jgi:hypothetical protein
MKAFIMDFVMTWLRFTVGMVFPTNVLRGKKTLFNAQFYSSLVSWVRNFLSLSLGKTLKIKIHAIVALMNFLDVSHFTAIQDFSAKRRNRNDPFG